MTSSAEKGGRDVNSGVPVQNPFEQIRLVDKIIPELAWLEVDWRSLKFRMDGKYDKIMRKRTTTILDLSGQ